MKIKSKRIRFCRKTALLIIIITAVSATGCLRLQTNIKEVKQSAIPMEDIEYDIVDSKTVEGKSSSFYLFWFIPVTPELSLEEAIDDAIKNSNGHNLVNVTIYREKQYLILGTVNILRVQGVAVKYK